MHQRDGTEDSEEAPAVSRLPCRIFDLLSGHWIPAAHEVNNFLRAFYSKALDSDFICFDSLCYGSFGKSIHRVESSGMEELFVLKNGSNGANNS